MLLAPAVLLTPFVLYCIVWYSTVQHENTKARGLLGAAPDVLLAPSSTPSSATLKWNE